MHDAVAERESTARATAGLDPARVGSDARPPAKKGSAGVDFPSHPSGGRNMRVAGGARLGGGRCTPRAAGKIEPARLDARSDAPAWKRL